MVSRLIFSRSIRIVWSRRKMRCSAKAAIWALRSSSKKQFSSRTQLFSVWCQRSISLASADAREHHGPDRSYILEPFTKVGSDAPQTIVRQQAWTVFDLNVVTA